MIDYVCREIVHERLMDNPLAAGYHSLSDEDKDKYLEDIMGMQYSESAKKVLNFLAARLQNEILKMPLSLRLRHTTCRTAMLYLGED